MPLAAHLAQFVDVTSDQVDECLRAPAGVPPCRKGWVRTRECGITRPAQRRSSHPGEVYAVGSNLGAHQNASSMASIDRYIFRTIFGRFLLILINLTMVIWITQILRQVDLITNQGQTILVFLRITGLLVPILTMVIAPIAIVIAVCYALLKLNGDSELVVMSAAGISPRRAFLPVLASCIMVAVFVAYISAFLAPRLQRKMAMEIAKVRTDVVSNIVRPSAFTSVDRGLIFHIRERRGDNQFQGLFLDYTAEPEERVTIVAEYGRIVQRDDNAFLVMRDGNVQRRRAKERHPTIVVFDQYAFDLTRLAPAPQANVGLRQQYVSDISS